MSRRALMMGGATLAAATLVQSTVPAALAGRGNPDTFERQMDADDESRPANPHIITPKEEGHKPTFLPEQGVTDPAVLSQAETIFWSDQMREHALLFAMMMPGPDNAAYRTQFEAFVQQFTDRYRQAKSVSLDRSNYASFNQGTIELAKRISDLKHRAEEDQAKARIHTLAWPLFFHHTAREADWLATRLTRLSRGEIGMGREEAVKFWANTMAEHAQFIAHLLDPQEGRLIRKAREGGEMFNEFRDGDRTDIVGHDGMLSRVHDLLKFKGVALTGVDRGLIKSTVHPVLADHVRREAVKAADDLRRIETAQRG